MDFFQNLTAQQVFFYLFAALAVGSALEVVMQRNPLHSAIALVFTFAAFAANYILLQAQFIAAIQIIVYGGAIIVLFVFVIMLLNVRAEESRLDRHQGLRILALPCIIVVLAAMIYTIRISKLENMAMSPDSATVGTVETIGRDLFSRYLLPFEATSVLIMMAIVGALVLAQRTLTPVESQPVVEAEPERPEAVEPEAVEV